MNSSNSPGFPSNSLMDPSNTAPCPSSTPPRPNTSQDSLGLSSLMSSLRATQCILGKLISTVGDSLFSGKYKNNIFKAYNRI